MAADSLSNTDDKQTQNRKIREQLGDNVFMDKFQEGGGYNG